MTAREGYITGYLTERGVVHAVGGHSDATGCVRWYDTTRCGGVRTRGYWIPIVARTVTCVYCVARVNYP